MKICTPVLAALSLTLASPAATQDSSQTQAFRVLIERRLAALRNGDVARYVELLDKDYVAISDLGARRTLAEMPAYVAEMANPARRYQVRSLHVRIMGELALVDAEIGEDMVDSVGAWRESDVFIQSAGQWRYLHRQDTAVLHAPSPVPMKNETLEDFVGQYRTAGGTVDIFTAKDGVLYCQTGPTGAPIPLVHVGLGAFSAPGMPDLIIFSRGSQGKVEGFVAHLPSGQIIPSERVARP